MKYLFTVFSIFCFFATVANATCNKLKLTSDFLTPYETEYQKWSVSEPYYYDDPKLGFSINLKTSGTTINFYAFDLGIEDYKNEMIDKLLRQSVSEMLQVMNYTKTLPTSDPRLLPENLFKGSEKYLVHNAVYVVQERKPRNIVSIVSVGFDGKCFQKLRFTKDLISKDIDIKNYFDNPTQDAETMAAIFLFSGLVKILNEELYRVSYYK
jgi:hypothetical protein